MKLTNLFLSVFLVSLSAYGNALTVLACEPEWKALALELVGEDDNVYSATTAFQDPHHIQARPSLISKARRADLLFCTGAELEAGWLPLLTRKSANKRIQKGSAGYFMAADQVSLLGGAREVDRSDGDVHGGGDPHFFLDPHYISSVAKALMERLILVDDVNAGEYKSRYKNFNARWALAIKKWEAQATPLRGASYVVHHNNWRYLTQWLGLNALTTLEPKPGLPPTSRHLSFVLKSIEGQEVEGILVGSYQDRKAADWLQEKAGLPVVLLPYTVGGGKEVTSLFALFDHTIAALLKYSQR